MMGMTPPRHPKSVRERILDAATDLFYKKGVNNVGVDEVVASSGVSKMSLYKHFGSKEALVKAYIGRWEDRWLEDLRASVKAAGSAPEERLLAVFDVLEQSFEEPDFRGSARMNGAIEVADRRHPAYQRCVEGRGALRAFMLGLAQDAHVADPEAFACQMLTLIDGAVVAALLRDGREAARTGRSAAHTLLAASMAH